ncbi:MAG TPA: SPFH domain-containing protein, partial [Nitrospiria bacterium]|nr:SPFH domain-containing protein [Nitrospiria bacterium]
QGKGLDVFGPGRHRLSTNNIPILTKILSLPYGFTSPFRVEVYFVNQKQFVGLKWGTQEPVAFKDAELGLVRLRAFGTYNIRIAQPLLFINTLSGTLGKYTTPMIQEFLRNLIVARLNDFLGENLDTIFNLPKRYDEMGDAVREKLSSDFRRYGLELFDFLITSITPPEGVQKRIDERGEMEAVGPMDRFMRFKMAKAMGDSAQNPGGGGMAGGMGLVLGAGAGMAFPGMLQGSSIPCPDCHNPVPDSGRFCPHCGHQMVVLLKCPRCAKNLPASAKFCSSCGLNLSEGYHCPKCNASLPFGTQFCTQCGEQLPGVKPA